MGFLLALLITFLAFISLVFLIGYLLSVKPYEGPISDHFDGKKFINPSQISANGIIEVGSYVKTRTPDKWHDTRSAPINPDPIPALTNPNQIQYTFINHSTFLIQVDGLNILTDPIWSYRCSPFQFAGPHRWRPPGIKFENLPEIHVVLLTHNHYDHMDANTLKRVWKKWNPTAVVPLGLTHQVKKYGAKKIKELDWWESTKIEETIISATPANHFSSRGLFDRDKTLWCGFHLRTATGSSIYYAGDTGYSPVFKEIGQRVGPMDLSFIPIGAYLPEWFMSPIHISPPQAVQVHQDVNSKKSVAMHFGTFPLADDNPERSKAELIQSRIDVGLKSTEFSIPVEGVTYQV